MTQGLILFVHGLGGSASGTWKKFPDLVRSARKLGGYDVGLFEYPTTVLSWKFWKKYPSVQTLGDALRTVIDVRYPGHRPIVLVTHSLGGLVARSYLVDAVMGGDPLRVEKLLLYAVPNTGAGLANVSKHLSWGQPQLRQLCKESDLIRDLNRAWERLRVSDKVRVRYAVAAGDHVVNEASARHFPGHPKVCVDPSRGHRTLVKPTSHDDLPFEILESFVLEEQASAGPVASMYRNPHYKVIALDLAGTLIRGLKFSWTLVWQHLGYPEEVYSAGMRRFLKGETTYAEWCRWAVEMYRSKGLKREHFKGIIQELSVTKNLREGIRILKNDGYKVGIISGGIDTILYELIPDADELFDYIFINRLQFDAEGLVCGVVATEYDFDGKADALKNICTANGCGMEDAVFVGDGFNDGHASEKAGLSIAYPPRDYTLRASSNVQIQEDDLMRVVECVMGA